MKGMFPPVCHNTITPWTADEDIALGKVLVSGVTWAEAATRLGRSWGQVYRRAQRLGISKVAAASTQDTVTWSADEDIALRTVLASGVTWEQAATRLGRHFGQILRRAQKLGIRKIDPPVGYFWTPEKREQLRELMLAGKKCKEIAKIMKCRPGAIYVCASRLGWRFIRPKDTWTAKEDAALRSYLATEITWAEAATRLGRPLGQVSARAAHIGIRKCPSFSVARKNTQLKKLIRDGKKCSEIAEIMGISKWSVYKMAAGNGCDFGKPHAPRATYRPLVYLRPSRGPGKSPFAPVGELGRALSRPPPSICSANQQWNCLK